MGHKRRGERRRERELEALQVELLAGQDADLGGRVESTGRAEGADDGVSQAGRLEPAADAVDGAHTAEPPRPVATPEVRSASDEETPASEDASPTPGSIPSDRWARAVGRRGPARAPGTEGGLPNGEALLRAADGLERQETARNHAAARIRPAGEPLARAKELVQQGRVDEAIDLYLGILTVNPSNLKARNNLGVLLDELRQYDAALEHFAAAERIAPENVEVLTNYASALTSVARYDQAEALLRRAQKLDAESLDVRLGIGILYFRRGLYAHAEQELGWVCARSRNNGQPFYYRGEALNRLGRFDEARQAMERAKVLMPNDPRPLLTLGHLYDRQHQAEEAAEMYRQARRLQKR